MKLLGFHVSLNHGIVFSLIKPFYLLEQTGPGTTGYLGIASGSKFIKGFKIIQVLHKDKLEIWMIKKRKTGTLIISPPSNKILNISE
jgi:hypothetical protein